MQNNAYFNHILQLSSNFLQRNVNYLTIIAIFAGSINIQAKCMNMQKRKSERMETGNRKNGGEKLQGERKEERVTSVNYFNILKHSKKRAKNGFRLFVIYSNKPTPGL